MKKLLCMMLALCFAGSADILADNITVDGRSRTYLPYVPKDLGENRPLLISMHGMNQDANYQKGMLAIESIADTAKFAVVFPEGLNRSWDISGRQDINFVLAVIDDMVKKHAIDRDRVYLSGFSMGGMFTYHAMNHIADKIAAFAPISGYPMGGQPFQSSRPVPIIHTHGTGDDVVGFDGVQRSLDGWIARNNCSATPFVTKSYRTHIATRYQWGPGDGSAEVVLLELADKGHWISNDGLMTGEEIWNFCKRYSLNRPEPEVAISYPLDATEFVTVGAPDKESAIVHIEAEAGADVASVSFYGDNVLLGTVAAPPYTFDWTGATTGTHLVTVAATDASGATASRGMPVSIKVVKQDVNMGARFNADGYLPAGWVVYDGRSTRTGELSGLTGGSRVVKLTGSSQPFGFALYHRNSSGGEYNAYCAYGDRSTRASMLLFPGTYEVSYDACNYNSKNGTSPVICRVYDNSTDELLGETSMMPTDNLGGDLSAPITGNTGGSLTFTIDTPRFCRVVFYPGEGKGDDLLLGTAKIKKLKAQGIDDVITDSPVVSVDYYDLQGRPLASPTGLTIVRALHADGSITTAKTLR